MTCLLRGLGFTSHAGYEIDEDYVAALAGTNILTEDEEISEAIKAKIRRGILTEKEATSRFRESIYKFKLPTTSIESELGTSVRGLIEACTEVTDGRVVPLPLPSVDRNREVAFTQEKFRGILNLIFEKRESWKSQAILNYRADKLLNMNSPHYTLFDLLSHLDDEARYGYDPWPVGHFVTLAGLIKSKATDALALLIRDAYKHKGFQGYHIQPFETVRKALIRNDGRGGGVLLLVSQDAASEARISLENLGVDIYPWDNGSPYRPSLLRTTRETKPT